VINGSLPGKSTPTPTQGIKVTKSKLNQLLYVVLFAALVSITIFKPYVAADKPAAASIEICIGDSLTNGHQNTNPSDSRQAYPHLLATLLAAKSFKQPQANSYVMPDGALLQNESGITVVKYGIESQKLEAMIENFKTQVLAHAANANQTTVTLLGGTNNTPTDTPEQIYQKWRQYAALCKESNIRLRIMTLPALRDEPYRSVALGANALLRADHAFADEFVDLARNTAFADATDQTFYYSDGVHLRTAANQKIAELILRVRDKTYTAPAIATMSLSQATRNSLYNQTLTAKGGVTAWQLKSGDATLPAGITFNAATHKFAGTPTEAGTFENIVIRAIDENGNFDEKTYSLIVAATPERSNH